MTCYLISLSQQLLLLSFQSIPFKQIESKVFSRSNEIKAPSRLLSVKFLHLIISWYKSRTKILCFRNLSCSLSKTPSCSIAHASVLYCTCLRQPPVKNSQQITKNGSYHIVEFTSDANDGNGSIAWSKIWPNQSFGFVAHDNSRQR